ncbi:MAG: hypothetical protein J6B43_07965 [Lachnospiraceae bacterium]|nr:hypothetical protein [Lachnospiraceae bacterium]
MTDISQSFERAYALVKQNIEASGSSVQLPGSRVVLYLNTCTPGILDVQELLDADRTEFLQMAYYSLLEILPEQEVIRRWQAKTELSDWAYRKAVLDTLMQNPEVAAKGRVIRNNIYAEADAAQGYAGRSLKQRLLSAGYQVSRRLPLCIKVPLKKLAMKLLMRG